MAFQIQAESDTQVSVTHAPFRPATRYEVFLESGVGPDSALLPNRWPFWSGKWRVYLPRIVAWK